jgi:hypothetical protein
MYRIKVLADCNMWISRCNGKCERTLLHNNAKIFKRKPIKFLARLQKDNPNRSFEIEEF